MLDGGCDFRELYLTSSLSCPQLASLVGEIIFIIYFRKGIFMEQLTFEYLVNRRKEIVQQSKISQKREMDKLNKSISKLSTGMYIKANTIANKAVSEKFGYEKALKKSQMSAEMLKERQRILEQVTALMVAQSLGADIPHISKVIYNNLQTCTS